GGHMATSIGNMLPYDPNSPGMYLAGDVRANEQIGLTSMHTLFVREHNFWADRLAAVNPTWNDEQIYQEARKMVGAELQSITYNEFLPTLLGNQFSTQIGSYSYDANIDPGIANEFSTAAYRIGHTMLPNELQVLNEDGSEQVIGGVPLAEAFFRPDKVAAYGIEGILRGLAATDSQEIDNLLVDGVRNMLFVMPGMSFGLDLASLNIQRGRDHGLPTYNEMRLALGLSAVTFGDGTFLACAEPLLMDVYADVDDIDLWVGLLSEIHHGDGMVGETAYAIIFDQFYRLMNGDDFWCEKDGYLGSELLAEVNAT
ncbi:MAG: peroxidase family protein, partial [Alphaproteobacteria bacterium]